MLNALATRLAAATPEPTPAPAGGGSVWSQSTQLADLGANGLSPNVSFLVATLLFLLAVAAGFLALSQGFTAGKVRCETWRGHEQEKQPSSKKGHVMTTTSWMERRNTMLGMLRVYAGRGQRPAWAEDASRIVIQAEAALWAAGVVPSPRPM